MKKLFLTLLFAACSAIASAQVNPGFAVYRNTGQYNAPVTISAAAKGVFGFTFINVNTVPVYMKFYNQGTSTVVGTTGPQATIMIPAGNGTTPGAVYCAPGSVSWQYFQNALTVAAVTGIADSSNASPATAIYVEVYFK
jgi:hypothetical protein